MSTTTLELSPAVKRYLVELELALKQRAGVIIEDALCDAREFLQESWQTLLDCRPDLTCDEAYQVFVRSFGKPVELAEEYADVEQPPQRGYAPGWRIYCTQCGRSAPCDRVGIIRVAARSHHKLILGRCSYCGVRPARLIQDLNQITVANRMRPTTTPAELRPAPPPAATWTAVWTWFAVGVLILTGVILVRVFG